jgi:hypothetical protein
MALSVEHPATMVNGTKDPVAGEQDYGIGRVDRKGF